MARKNLIIKTEEEIEKFFKAWDTSDSGEVKKIIIPASVESIAEDCNFNKLFCFIEIPEHLLGEVIKSELIDAEILFKVTAENGEYYYAYINAQDSFGEWCKYCLIPYPERYSDELECSDFSPCEDEDIDCELLRCYDTERNTALKAFVRVCRLASPVNLSANCVKSFSSYVKRNILRAVEEIAEFDCPDLIKCLFDYNLVTEEKKAKIIEILQEKEAVDCLAYFK